MWVVKLLGGLDIISSFALVGWELNIIPFWILVFSSFDLLCKAVMFYSGKVSLFDGVIGIYILLAPFVAVDIISYILSAYLFQKGALSFL